MLSPYPLFEKIVEKLNGTGFRLHRHARLVIAVSALAVVQLTGCNKIEGPYRERSSQGVVYISDDSVSINGELFGFTVDNSAPAKKVLVEDYTGMLCGNCPYVGKKLNDTIQPQYGDRLVVISVHAGFFAIPCPGGLACPGTQPPGALTTDFRCPAGEAWDGFFGNSVAGNPNGLIDRAGYPGQQIKVPGVWQSNIQQRSLFSAPFAVRIANKFNPVNRELKIAVQTRASGDQNGTYKLSVVVVQDSVVDWQEWYPPHVQFDSTYIHRDVLRTAVNSSFGEEITTGPISNGTRKIRGYTVTLDAAWNADHCHVIAFIYDAANYEVKQVEKVSVTQ